MRVSILLLYIYQWRTSFFYTLDECKHEGAVWLAVFYLLEQCAPQIMPNPGIGPVCCLMGGGEGEGGCSGHVGLQHLSWGNECFAGN